MINDAGLQLVKSFEGLRLSVYNDQAGRQTVGWGHLILPGEHFTTITEREAENLLRKDLAIAERAIQAMTLFPITAPEHANRYAALTSFVFNVGRDAYRGSTVRAKVNRNQYDQAADHLLDWCKITQPKTGLKVVSQGLLNRRRAERELFLRPVNITSEITNVKG